MTDIRAVGRRMRAVLFTALFCTAALLASAADAPPAKPVDAAGWSALALRDAEAIHALLRDQTMIPYDTENPAYPRWLKDGLVEARKRAADVTNEVGYYFTLLGYIHGFRDPHFALAGIDLSTTQWSGFIAASRGDQVVVTLRDPDDPAVPALGAVIESCDGKTPLQLVQQRLSPFFGAGPLQRDVSKLFLDFHNPFVPLPALCSVRTGDQVAEVPLRWRPISTPSVPASAFMQEILSAGRSSAAAWGLTEPVPGVFWIGAPTFLHNGETGPKLHALVDAKARGDEMRNARAIVIDTRGNGGGTTLWARRLADAVFTPKVMEAPRKVVASQRVARELRASPENVAALRRFSEAMAGETTAAQQRDENTGIDKLERAIRNNPPVLREGSKKVSPPGGMTARRPLGKSSPFPAKVYFLSNGSCVSACLSFADAVLMVPGVRLVGSATGGDTPYTNIRREMLPSGLVGVVLSQEVIRGRGRAPLEAYQPDVPYDGSWDDASLRAWVLALIESEQHKQ